jgi:hypothetical protein
MACEASADKNGLRNRQAALFWHCLSRSGFELSPAAIGFFV